MLRSTKEALILVENQRRQGVFTDAEAALLHKHIVAGSAAVVIRGQVSPLISRLAAKLGQMAAELEE